MGKILLPILGTYTTDYYRNWFVQHNVEVEEVPFDFVELNEFLPNRFNEILPRLDSLLEFLADRSEEIVVPNITLHESLEMHETYTGLDDRLLHPVHLLGAKLKNERVSTITIFGSEYTMTSGYVARILDKYDVSVNELDSTLREKVDTLRKMVYSGKDYSALLDEVISDMQKIDFPIALACTELSVAIPRSPNVYDMVDIQLEGTLNG